MGDYVRHWNPLVRRQINGHIQHGGRVFGCGIEDMEFEFGLLRLVGMVLDTAMGDQREPRKRFGFTMPQEPCMTDSDYLAIASRAIRDVKLCGC